PVDRRRASWQDNGLQQPQWRRDVLHQPTRESAYLKPTIFIVDDDAAVLKAQARVLREEGWSVETFESAEAFLGGPGGMTDGCLVLDVTMPGIDGFALQRKLAESGRSLPVVFVSGYGDIPTSVRALKAG